MIKINSYDYDSHNWHKSVRAWDEVVDKKPFPIYTNQYDFHTLIFDLDDKPYDIFVSYGSNKS